MKLTSSSFFHFASDLQAIIDILKKGFNVYYCLEEIYSSSSGVQHIGIPMVSFCDIPLNFVSKNNYGKYAIGMSRSWGISHELLPVSYYPNNKNCLSTKNVIAATNSFLTARNNPTDYRVLGYSKPMYKIAPPTKKNISLDNYQEREWRKVYASVLPNVWKTEAEYKKYRGNKSTPKKQVGTSLKFSPRDVDFIIIRESDRQQLIDYIMRSGLTYLGGKTLVPISSTDQELLLTKIVSYESLIDNI